MLNKINQPFSTGTSHPPSIIQCQCLYEKHRLFFKCIINFQPTTLSDYKYFLDLCTSSSCWQQKISAITDKFQLLVTDLQLSQPCPVRQIARGSLFLLILAQMISPILEIFPPGKYWIYFIIKWASSGLSVLVVDVPKNPTKTMFKILPCKKIFLWALEMSIPIKRSDL